MEAKISDSLEELNFLHKQIEKFKMRGKRKYLERKLKKSKYVTVSELEKCEEKE